MDTSYFLLLSYITFGFATILSACFSAEAKEPVATVVVVDSEIEIIDSNTVNQ